MEQIPTFVHILFLIATAGTVALLFLSSHKSLPVLLFSLGWLALHGAIGLTGFYTVNNTVPPHLALLLGPAFIILILLFVTAKGKAFTRSLDLKWLTYLHAVRIPVEMVLFYLFVNGQVPGIMTFEGRNFDILAGITAPVIAYFGFTRKTLPRKVLIGWNVICLALVANIVFIGILSVETPFQQFGFSQPNKALGYFPYLWLPGFIVPVVLFSHLVSISRLWKRNESRQGNGDSLRFEV